MLFVSDCGYRPGYWLSAFTIGLGAWLGLGCGSSDEDQCPEPSATCDGSCVSLTSDDDNCGSCGTACKTGQFCSDGACELACGKNQKNCDDACVGTVSDVANCGDCDASCKSGEFCDDGACSETCSGVLCPGLGGTTECAHLETDPDHCGSCGNACAAGSECQAGVCKTACPGGRTLCGKECVDLLGSPKHCGACGNACEDGVACLEGTCGDQTGCVGEKCPCPDDKTRCGTACVDAESNAFNCGECGVTCATDQSCVSGECACPNGGLLCGDACLDAKTDNANCGTCGNTCSGGKTCQAGSCVCEDPKTTDCDGTCVDLNASLANCGSCGHACVGLETCEEGTCFYDVGDDCGGAAKNVSVTKVALYQAVEIPLFDNGALIASEARTADIVQAKAAMVRVHLDVAPGFSARNLSARLYLDNGGPQAEAFFKKKQVSVDSTQDNLDSTLNIQVPAEKVQATTKYHVELVECGGNATGSEGTTRVPAKDETALDARKTGPIKVAFLPFRYNELVPDTSAEALKTYSDEIMKKFGTTEVVLTVLPEFGDYSGTVNLNTLLDAVRIKRGQDGPPADVYYYGLVRPTQDFSSYCNGYCTTGVAYQPGGTAAFRVGIGIAFGDTRSAGTFAHELGHNHDRPHAPCGGAGNPDAAFPYADGGIGTWGYDAVAAQLKNPATHKDLMGYCSPAWVSDYNFALMSDVVAKVNENTFKVLSEPVTWDALSVEPSGISWSAPQVMTEFPKEAWTEAVVYDGKGNELTRVDAFRFVRSEDQGYLLVVPPRKPGWYAIGAVGGPAIVYP